MRARLIPKSDGEPVDLDKPLLLVGRSPSSDIQLASRKISRLHCCLCLLEDSVCVRDLDSTNGVRVNGDKVSAGRLGPGDELTIGDLTFRVVLESGSTGPEPAELEGSVADGSEAAYEPSSDDGGTRRRQGSVIELGEDELLPLESDDGSGARRHGSAEQDNLDLLADNDPFDLGEDGKHSRGSSEIKVR